MPTPPILRTGAWYGDRPLDLSFPSNWDVTTLWPRTLPLLSDREIEAALAHPVGRPPLSDLCHGRSSPLVIVDDMNRPTPAARVMPWVLRQFAKAGLQPGAVTILMAGGSHGPPRRETIARKIGREAMACRVVVHDPRRHTVRVGRTSAGTPVLVNREVPAADVVIGIGGVYPNHTAGYGGGSKLAMGVLDIRVISQLHHATRGSGWGAEGLRDQFRRELDEIARIIGLEFVVSLQVNSDREVVRVRCGDPAHYLADEIAFAREAYRAPPPDGADVVIANAFPNDLSLTFALVKGDFPLRHCAPRTSRVLIAACSEGEGFHGVYPVVRAPRFHDQRDRIRRLSLLSAGEITGKVKRRLRRALAVSRHEQEPARVAKRSAAPAPTGHPVWLYCTRYDTTSLPRIVRGTRIVGHWSEILEAVSREQESKPRLRALIYPCAPLQVPDLSRQGS